MQNCLCPQLSALFFINSLTIQPGRLRKSPPLRGVILQAGNVWTTHPRRLQRVFTRQRPPGGWRRPGFMLEVWTQVNTFCLELSQRGLCTSAASWPRSAGCPARCSLALPQDAPPRGFSAHTRAHVPAVSAQPAAPGRSSSTLGQTRRRRRNQARSAGQRRGFLSKCLWPGFLLTEGWLGLAPDTPRGGSQGPSRQARPAGTRRGSCGALMQLSDDILGDTGVRPREL